MTTPPGQEPRPGFTPHVGQPRPGARGDSRWPKDQAEPGDVEDYWLSGGQPGTRRPGSRPSPSFSPAPAGNRNPAGNRDRAPDVPDSGRARPATPGLGPRDAGYGDPGYRDLGHRDPAGRRGGYETARNPRQFRGNSAFVSGNSSDDAIIRSGLLASPGLRWVGTWSLRRAAWVLLGAALLGMIGTIVVGRDPGFLIGLMTIVGSVVAAFGARRRAVHKLLPLPALSYLVTTTIAGMVHERANLNDSKEYVTSFLTWIGGAFFAVVWATVLVLVISLARWLLSKRVVAGNLPAADGPAAGGPAAGRNPAGRPSAARAPRGVADPRDPYGGGGPYSGGGGGPYSGGGARGDQRSWGDRESPDSRERRDPWGERGTPGNTRGYRPHDFGDRGRRADMDARDPWAAVDGQGDRDAGRRADRGRDYPDPRDSRDYRDNHRPRPGGGPGDIW